MNVIEAIASRRSIRKYKQNQIGEEELDIVVKAGCSAPIASADYKKNHITIIQNKSILEKISTTIAEHLGMPKINPLYDAPTLIIVSGKEYPPFKFKAGHEIPQENIEYLNAACITENMILAATDIGLGSVYLTGCLYAFTLEPELLKTLKLPKGFRPLSALALGYYEENLREKRKSNNKIVVDKIV